MPLDNSFMGAADVPGTLEGRAAGFRTDTELMRICVLSVRIRRECGRVQVQIYTGRVFVKVLRTAETPLKYG